MIPFALGEIKARGFNGSMENADISVNMMIFLAHTQARTWSTFEPGAEPYILSTVKPSSQPILRAKRSLPDVRADWEHCDEKLLL